MFLTVTMCFNWKHAERAKHLWGTRWPLHQHWAVYRVSEGAGQSHINLPATSKYTRSTTYSLLYHIKPTLWQLPASSGYREPIHVSIPEPEPTVWIWAQWDLNSSDVLFPVANPARGGKSGRSGPSGSHLKGRRWRHVSCGAFPEITEKNNEKIWIYYQVLFLNLHACI